MPQPDTMQKFLSASTSVLLTAPNGGQSLRAFWIRFGFRVNLRVFPPASKIGPPNSLSPKILNIFFVRPPTGENDCAVTRFGRVLQRQVKLELYPPATQESTGRTRSTFFVLKLTRFYYSWLTNSTWACFGLRERFLTDLHHFCV